MRGRPFLLLELPPLAGAFFLLGCLASDFFTRARWAAGSLATYFDWALRCDSAF